MSQGIQTERRLAHRFFPTVRLARSPKGMQSGQVSQHMAMVGERRTSDWVLCGLNASNEFPR
jgi:hypothetical protein|tara:strand:- start:347 stop:532 length:186 start_codon:yes stop_codon:yes gene_type:complete